eukprot:TRINITY_DN130_c0_g2_i1.p1 TRINITY_DN130_c0_g2~~TRINITY_DN130_c0_g2_i1.p1  ORF type:complete len:160 (-),score=35.69 TRINITY_DN130_c0_g2_i1:107-586(-)
MSYPYGYGGYPPAAGYAAPYGAPGYVAPVYGAPAYGTPAYPVNPYTPTAAVAGFVPSAYLPGRYQYSVAYYPGQPFILPYGLPPHLQAKMMQASYAFRMFDTNMSGSLSKKEWKRALRHLGIHIPKYEGKRWFAMADSNYSGSISEREFCEWWIMMFPY